MVGNDPKTEAYNNVGLAERWEASEDFKTWTFYRKPDAEWHFDWGPVTAADVLRSYELHTAPDVSLTRIDQLKADRVEVVDDHTIASHFERARTDFAFPLAGRGWCRACQNSSGTSRTAIGRGVVAAGPFACRAAGWWVAPR